MEFLGEILTLSAPDLRRGKGSRKSKETPKGLSKLHLRKEAGRFGGGVIEWKAAVLRGRHLFPNSSLRFKSLERTGTHTPGLSLYFCFGIGWNGGI